MEKIINVFARHEIKYLLTAEMRKKVLEGIKDRMIPDPHGVSTIRNIYYDTPDYLLIRRSLEKPKYKEKMRLRSYGKPGDDTVVFLEMKKKFDGVVYKRRVELKEKDAVSYMDGAIGLEEMKERIVGISTPQIAKEIDYFKSFYGNLRPMVYLSYDRCAYFSTEDESLRITFDKNIRWSKEDVRLTTDEAGQDLLEKGESLMEIKTGSALPMWLVDVITKAGARPASFSKYGNAYKAIVEGTTERIAKETAEEIAEREEKGNDKYIQQPIYGKRTYTDGVYYQPGDSLGTWGGNRLGVLVPHSPF